MTPSKAVNLRPDHLTLIALAAVMLGTRMEHFRGLPDASWAVFFIGGVYLRNWRAFLMLMAEAVGIDYLTTQHMGVSSYCISPAYPFLLPAYASLWFAGRFGSSAVRGSTVLETTRGASALLLGFTLCFLLTNGSFYWISGRVGTPTLSGWWSNATTWYAPFLLPTLLYAGGAVLLARIIAGLQRRAALTLPG
jgi:hypothetical protein